MTAATTPTVVLDSSVLFSRVLHELFGRLAIETGLFTIAWSDELLAETERVLIERKPVSEAVAQRWVGYLRVAFPDGRKVLDAAAGGVDLSSLTCDRDDEHVCALALATAPVTLITFDDGFSAAALARHNVSVMRPDEYLLPWCDEQPDPFLAITEHQAAAWRDRPVTELLDAFERAGTPRLADRLRTLIG